MTEPGVARRLTLRLAALVLCVAIVSSGCASPRELVDLSGLRAQALARLDAGAYHVLIEEHAGLSQGLRRPLRRVELVRDRGGRSVRAMEILSVEGPTIVVVVDDEGFRFYVPGEQTIWVGGPDVVELLDGFPMPPGAGRNLAETLDELFYGWLSDPSWSVAGQNRWGRPRAVVLERPLFPAQPGISPPGPSVRLWVDAATGLPLRLRSGPNTELVVRRLDLDPANIHPEIAPALPEGSQVIEAELVHSDNLRAAAAIVGRFLVAPPDGGGVVVTGVRVARNLPGGAFVVLDSYQYGRTAGPAPASCDG